MDLIDQKHEAYQMCKTCGVPGYIVVNSTSRAVFFSKLTLLFYLLYLSGHDKEERNVVPQTFQC